MGQMPDISGASYSNPVSPQDLTGEKRNQLSYRAIYSLIIN